MMERPEPTRRMRRPTLPSGHAPPDLSTEISNALAKAGGHPWSYYIDLITKKRGSTHEDDTAWNHTTKNHPPHVRPKVHQVLDRWSGIIKQKELHRIPDGIAETALASMIIRECFSEEELTKQLSTNIRAQAIYKTY